MVRQYIGARYVPKFSDPINWSNTIPYEALTIVLYNGNSYTSKKPVPTGVDILDTEYWVCTGNFNAQIRGLEEQIGNVDESVENIRKQNIVLIGDSYGTKNGAYLTHDTINTPLPNVIKEYMSIDDNNFHHKYVNGSGFANGGYLNNLVSLANELDESVTDIYVMGGWNDETTREGLSEELVEAGMQSFSEYVKQTYPLAKFHLIFVASGVYNDIQVSTGGDGYYSVGLLNAWRLYMTSGKYGFAYHNDASYVLHNSAFIQDEGIHPNQTGVYELAKAIVSIIRGNVADYQYRIVTRDGEFVAVAGTTNNCATNGTVLFEQVTSNGVHIDFYTETGATLIMYNTPVQMSLNGGSYKVLERAPKCSLGYVNFLNMSVPISVIDSEGNSINVSGQLVLRPNALYVTLPYIPETNLAPKSVLVSKIMIGSGSTNCNEMYGL